MKEVKVSAAPPRTAKSIGAPTWSENKNKYKIVFSNTWKPTSGQFKKSSKSRTEWFQAQWSFSFDIANTETPGKKTKYGKKAAKEKKTLRVTTKKSITYPRKLKKNQKALAKGPKRMSRQQTVVCYYIPKDNKKLSQTANRKAFYPFTRTKKTNKRKPTYRFLKKVTFKLWACNSHKPKNGKKSQSAAKALSKSISFKAPDEPKISSISIDPTSHKWSCTITAAKSTQKQERYDTKYRILRVQNFGKSYRSWKPYVDWTAFTGDSVTKSDVINDIGAFAYSHYIAIKVEAYSRGWAGRSKSKTYTRYFSYPAQPTISSVTPTPDSSKSGTTPVGRIVVKCSSHSSTEHPVDKMTLEVLKNSVYSEADDAAAAGNWEPVGVAGNKYTTAFADTYANSYPAAGRKVWYRIKSEHDQFVRYSVPFRAKDLEHSVGSADFVSATVVDDGVYPTGIKLLLGLKNRATGTQIEWSTFKNAIHSNRQPDSYKTTLVQSKSATEALNNSLSKPDHKVHFDFSTIFYITDLTEGEKYYLSALRYNEADSGTEYGERTYWKTSKDIQPVLFARKPTNVRMTVPSYVEVNAPSFEVSWTFDATVKQVKYTVYGVTAKRNSSGQIEYDAGTGKAKSELTVLATKNTEEMFARIDASQAKRCVENGQLVLRVAVSCGGPEAMSSNSAAIPIVQKPSVTVDISTAMPDGYLRTQEPAFTYSVDQLDSQVLMRVVSDGVVYPHPDGDYDQMEGEILYTGVLTPVSLRTPIESAIPRCEFLDGGKYSMSLTPIGSTGLRGETVTVSFRVDWEHQAHVAGALTRAVGDLNSVTATIHTEKPDNWVEGDLCDIYRVTPDGAYLIAEHRPFGQDIVDQFAPYSKRANLRYRVVTVTEDGDMDWIDVPYNLKAHGIRFDWIGSLAGSVPEYHSVTLPYNVKFSDSWTKQFEKVRDLAGAAVGWWGPGVDRKATLSTDMIRLGDIENKELVRELAQYPGPVFVRTPNGCAFTANVNVTSFADDYDSLVSPVSFDAEEIDLTEEFQVREEDL